MDCAAFFTKPLTMMVRSCLIDIPSLLMCTMVVICMIRVVRNNSEANNSNMFKYLLVKAFADVGMFAINVFYIRYGSTEYMRNSFAGQVWYIYFRFVVETVLYFVSSIMEVGATLDCLLTIKNVLKPLRSNLAFYYFLGFSIAMSLLFSVPQYKINSIKSLKRNITWQNVTTQETLFYSFLETKSPFVAFVFAATAILRDVVFLVMIVGLNLLIFWEMRKLTKRRVAMQEGSTSGGSALSVTNRSNMTVKRAAQAERTKAIMIMLTGINYMFGHLVIGVFQVGSSSGLSAIFGRKWSCVFQVGLTLLMISYGNSFVFYYYFNKQFRKFANETFGFLLYPFRKLFKTV